MTRKVLWPVLVIGALLVILPFAFKMPSRAAAGERMISDFTPIMQADQVQKTAMYYNDVFVPLGKVVPLFAQMPPSMQTGFGQMVQGIGVDPTVFAQVPAGLVHYKPLVTTMQANVDNYSRVDSLPSFRLFTWFFVVPGIVLMVLALYGLYGDRLELRNPFHHHARPTHA